MERFELPIACSQSRCLTKLGHIQLVRGPPTLTAPAERYLMAGFEPAISRFRFVRAAKLLYINT